uniref:hypothetical protein n=1 Tax=Alloprevotella sp. TaxID=1872471 RepID=UPI003FEF9BEA
MKKFTFLLTLLFACIGVTSHAQDVFQTSDAPSATGWAENTTWYKMSLKNFYLSTLNVDANGYLYANKADQFYGEQSWWCIVGNEETGYKFYNKRAGVNKVLGVSNMTQDGKARAEMCDVNSTNLATNFVFNTNGNVNNVFYFKEKNSNVYVNQRDGYFSNWVGGGNGDPGSSFRFYEVTNKETDLATEVTDQKNALNTAITNAETVQGDGLGYYTSTKIEAAKAAYNATSATADDYRNAIAALTPNQPKANTLYRLVSAYDGFETKQGVKKTIYANGVSMMWGTEATSNPTEYWLFEPTANGFYLKNAATHAYVNTAAQLQNTASRVVTISWPLKDGKPVANLRTGSDSPFHAGGHGGGAGVSSSLMGYGTFGSETNGASAWYIVPATLENVQTITGENVAAAYPSNESAVQVGLYSAEDVKNYANECNNLATATSLDNAVEAFNNLNVPTAVSFSDNKYYRFVNVSTSTDGNENTLGSKDGKAFCSTATNMNIDYVWQVISAENGKYNLKHATGLYLQPVQNGQTAKTALGANESNYELRNTETGVFKLYNTSGWPAQVETNASNTNYLNGWDGNNAKWKIYEVNYVEVPMNTVGEQKVATTCLPFDASNVEGAEVYTGKLNDAKNVLNMTKFEGGIPANQGVVLVGSADKATITIGATTATIGENDLQGTNTVITLADATRADYLVFGKDKDSNAVGFYTPSASVPSIPANKAYLNASALSAAAIALNFNGTATGVNTVVLGENGVNAPVFDLSGRRVVAPVKGGVYIQNGKKFIK